MINQKIIPTLKSSRLILRALNLNDTEDIFAYAKNKQVAQYVFWDPHQNPNDSAKFIKETIVSYQKEKKLMWGVLLKDINKLIGTCGFMAYYPTTKCLEIGYALNPEYWHKGYIKEALTTIIDYAFKQLDAIRIEGICVIENLASAKTMMSCDMEFEGILHDNFIKNNKIHHCKIFAITKRNYLKKAKK
ncbi:MAG: GNAT family N-acetyltransferase [Spiroplasma sp.]